MRAQYDVVVVGGGVAGLATGALLSHAGRKVVVLEKGNQLGGRAYTYVDQGFVLNYGAHAMYRPHTGFLAKILARLDLPSVAAPYPNPRASYWALEGRWGALGPMPQDLLTSPLFPFASRMRLLLLMAGFPLRRSHAGRRGDSGRLAGRPHQRSLPPPLPHHTRDAQYVHEAGE